jgi:hypothetical protein
MTASLHGFALLVAQLHEADAELTRYLDQDSDAGQDVEGGEDF